MYYCGVCKSISRNFGQLPRFGLVNETSVLSLILNIAAGKISTPEVLRKNCIAHPQKKSDAVIRNEAVDYAAGVNVLMMYFKLLDSWHDDKNLAAKAGSTAIRRAFRKAAAKYPIAADAVYFSIRELTKLEKEGCSSIDAACEPFASMMADLFMWKDSDVFCSEPTILDLLGKIGYNVGKWIYLIDAAADLSEDRRKNRYNVLAYRYGEHFDAAEVKFILEMCLAHCADAWERLTEAVAEKNEAENLNYRNAKGVADNLFYIGMRHTTELKCGGCQAGKNNESGEMNEPL
ncbi:MAG: hypothetical protein KHX22_04080 [Clostridiales bacterium]|nr:hypothetical protein [Clostridiales bacterium]